MQNQFVGRKDELERLRDMQAFGYAVLVVIKGRRRIGKSRLVEEFARGSRYLAFTGVAPIDLVTAQDQRDEFAEQLAKITGTNPGKFGDWSAAFYYLSTLLTNEPTVILFDEISWMGSKDHLFVPKLKNWWDLDLQKFPNVMLVFCGSVSVWIEKNIINSTEFFGRISLTLTLKQLSLPECAEFLRTQGFKASLYDIFKILAVTGGVPSYLKQISPSYTADENIKRLCFQEGGALVTDFDRIFHDLFNGNSSIYKKIIYLLADGMKSLREIQDKIDDAKTDVLSALVDDLIIAGFVSKHYSWSIKTEKLNTQNLYRLSDNYLRFFVKYIEPNVAKIDTHSFQDLSLQNLPNWDTIMGLQVENLLLNNRFLLRKALGLYDADIVADNPYIQRTSTGQRGCQIDYLVQTHTQNLFVCEFKFKRDEIGLEIIESMQEKISRFQVPQGYGIVPILFHFGGVKNSVEQKRYFSRIINIRDFLVP